MTPERLREIEARALAAGKDGRTPCCYHTDNDHEQERADSVFIEHARADILDLVAALDAIKEDSNG